MKKALLTLAAVIVAVAANAQGFVQLNNRVVGSVDAPVTVDGKPTTSAAYGASLANVAAAYGGFNVGLINATSGALLGATTTFRTDSLTRIGYVNAPLAGVDLAGATSVRLAAWKGSADTAGYAAAKASGLNFGESTAFAATGGVPPATPTALVGLNSFNIVTVPEPTTLALAALGGLALVIRRRK